MTVDVDLSEAGVESDDVVLVTIPAGTRFLRIARLTAAALASDLGFSLDDIEDLRIAVDESCAAVIAGTAPGSTLELRYLPSPEGAVVKVEGTCIVAPGSTVDEVVTLHPVAAELLEVTTSSFAFWSHDRGRSFRFDKIVGARGDDA